MCKLWMVTCRTTSTMVRTCCLCLCCLLALTICPHAPPPCIIIISVHGIGGGHCHDGAICGLHSVAHTNSCCGTQLVAATAPPCPSQPAELHTQGLYIYYRLQATYRRGARDLQRLDNTTRSPVFAFISESMAGLTSVRVFNWARFFSDTNRRQVRRHDTQCLLLSLCLADSRVACAMAGGHQHVHILCHQDHHWLDECAKQHHRRPRLCCGQHLCGLHGAPRRLPAPECWRLGHLPQPGPHRKPGCSHLPSWRNGHTQ